jgi:hypothetical protein
MRRHHGNLLRQCRAMRSGARSFGDYNLAGEHLLHFLAHPLRRKAACRRPALKVASQHETKKLFSTSKFDICSDHDRIERLHYGIESFVEKDWGLRRISFGEVISRQ